MPCPVAALGPHVGPFTSRIIIQCPTRQLAYAHRFIKPVRKEHWFEMNIWGNCGSEGHVPVPTGPVELGRNPCCHLQHQDDSLIYGILM